MRPRPWSRQLIHGWTRICSSRGFSPWAEDGRPHQAWQAYCYKRMNGAILDHGRKRDHVSRVTRHRLRDIRDAQAAGARSEAEPAAATGLTVRQVRDAIAAEALKPANLDTTDTTDIAAQAPVRDTLADDSAEADVEGQAVMSATMAAFLAAYDALDAEVRVVLALAFYCMPPPFRQTNNRQIPRRLDFSEIASAMFTSEQRIGELYLAACSRCTGRCSRP